MLTHCGAIDFGDFPFYVSGGVFEYVPECLVLSVEVGNEVLCAFGKVQYRFQVYYFSAG